MISIIKEKNSKVLYKAIAQKINNNELVVLPTETVYGLAGNSLSIKSIKSIYKIKNRPIKKKLIVHCSSIEMVGNYFKLDNHNLKIAKKFWPGPLTLILKRKNKIIPDLLCQRGYCAVRIPSNNFIIKLIKEINKPLVMPSANKFKQLSPVNAKMASENFKSSSLTIIDGGRCKIGIESTILKISNNNIEVIRYGLIDVFDILKISSDLKLRKTNNQFFPGTSKKHYSPSKPIFINVIKPKLGSGYINFGKIRRKEFKNLSTKENLKEAASKLYYYIYLADNHYKFKSISIAPIPSVGIGKAINDRLKRASAK